MAQDEDPNLQGSQGYAPDDYSDLHAILWACERDASSESVDHYRSTCEVLDRHVRRNDQVSAKRLERWDRLLCQIRHAECRELPILQRKVMALFESVPFSK